MAKKIADVLQNTQDVQIQLYCVELILLYTANGN